MDAGSHLARLHFSRVIRPVLSSEHRQRSIRTGYLVVRSCRSRAVRVCTYGVTENRTHGGLWRTKLSAVPRLARDHKTQYSLLGFFLGRYSFSHDGRRRSSGRMAPDLYTVADRNPSGRSTGLRFCSGSSIADFCFHVESASHCRDCRRTGCHFFLQIKGKWAAEHKAAQLLLLGVWTLDVTLSSANGN